MKPQSPAEVVIAQFGVRPLARKLGLCPNAPIQWRKRGGIVPATYHRRIIEMSEGQITPEDLVYGR